MDNLQLGISGLIFLGISFFTYFFLKKTALAHGDLKKSREQLLGELKRSQRKLGLGKWVDHYQKRIIEAGLYGGRLDGEKLLVLKEILPLVSLAVCLLLSLPWVLGLWFIIGSFFLPDIYLRDRKNKRNLEIIRGLPDFLDMITLVVEAGLDFGSAVQIVLKKGIKNAFADELDLAFNEVRLGASRAKALQHMAERIKIRDVTIFVNAVLQSEQMGTSMGAALRIQADSNRERRMQRAEKLALEAPVKMVFPLVLFIFPVVFIVLLGPIIIQWAGK
jgi:tight adherence protein C